MKNTDSYSHVRGESIYLDDIPLVRGTLFAAVFDSPVAHGVLHQVDVSEAEKMAGVVRIILAKDLRGENQIGGIIPNEPLLADEHVHFHGMPIALVLAESEAIARAAVHKIKANIEPLEVITDPRVACAKNELIVPPKRFQLGDTAQAFADCEVVVEGRADVNG
ncbi:MAG: hypothetical protein LH618_04445 [Saprospiraceae bacterium]|nr:hypothetical protein [Saprospiraceae bacterium]